MKFVLMLTLAGQTRNACASMGAVFSFYDNSQEHLHCRD